MGGGNECEDIMLFESMVGEEVTLEGANATLAAIAEEKERDKACWQKKVGVARSHSREVREAEFGALATSPIRKAPSTGSSRVGLEVPLPFELTASKVSLEDDEEDDDNKTDDEEQFDDEPTPVAETTSALNKGKNKITDYETKPKKKKGFFQCLRSISAGRKSKAEGGEIVGGPNAEVRMISGCEDSQTSSDVKNISSFELPDPAGKSGGACTSALLKVLYAEHRTPKKKDLSFVDVLTKMRDELNDSGFLQIPQLTASRPVHLDEPFHIVKRMPGAEGKSRALLIGINYVGQRGELSGCHNDVRNMKDYLMDVQGFNEGDITILMDDDEHPLPTRANILEAWNELVEESNAGDSVFFLYSGHGGKVRDEDRSEEDDGYDETILPLNYAEARQLRDDDIYATLVRPMAAGVTLTCLMDSCHSGTVLDLPYKFKADGSGSKDMVIDDGFDSDKFLGISTAKHENESSVIVSQEETHEKMASMASPANTAPTREPISDSEEDDASCGVFI